MREPAHHRGQPVRDDQDRVVLHHPVEGLLDHLLALAIQCARRLVQQQDLAGSSLRKSVVFAISIDGYHTCAPV